MQLPSQTSSAETLIKVYGVYHLTRLQADKNVKELAAAFEKSQARLSDKNASFDAAQVAAMRAMAVRDGEDEALDDTVRLLYAAILGKTRNNRKAPLFLRYFPDGMAPVVNAPLDHEIMKVNGIITRLGEEQDEDLKGFIGPLTSAMNNLQAAMDAHDAALSAEANAFAMIQAEKIAWLDTYKFNYRKLAEIYYQNPKKADTYFKPPVKAKKNGDGGEAAPTATKA